MLLATCRGYHRHHIRQSETGHLYGAGRTLPPGVEYEVQDAQEPHLFIIRKQHRSGPKTTAPLQYYYILDGNVYQAPSLHAALSSRIVRIRLLGHSSHPNNQFAAGCDLSPGALILARRWDLQKLTSACTCRAAACIMSARHLISCRATWIPS